MGIKLDLTGQVFGRLTVISEADPYISPKGKKRVKWTCQCECGVVKDVLALSLRRGSSQSCGCLKVEKTIERLTTHGQGNSTIKSREYKAWASMKGRCYNLNNISYSNYGGRGISVCDAWVESFETFLAEMGKCPENHSLDRIDNDGNYELSNCRWATPTVQSINKRTYSSNTSGAKGVSWSKRYEKWVSYIRVNKKLINLGCFMDINDAIAARQLAEEKYFTSQLLSIVI